MSPTISDALYALGCDGGWKIKNGKISGWTCKTPPPSDEAIKTKLKELETEYNAKQYQRDRLTEYPSIQELVVALYDADDKAEIDKKRAEIKKKYPKPE